MRAVRLTAPERLTISDVPAPRQSPGEALVRLAYVGLCGTDLEMFLGTMPYLQTGVAAFPLTLGHEWSGTVVASDDPVVPPGSKVVGDPVIGCGGCAACASGPATWCADRAEMGLRMGRPGALAELVAVPVGNLSVVPDGVTLRDAALTEPAVTAVAAVDRLIAVRATERVLVVGAGTLGLVATQVLVSMGAEVSVLLRTETRARDVESLGAVPLIYGSARLVPGFTASIEASGSIDGVEAAIAATRPGGLVALVGVYADVPLIRPNDLVLRDLTITGVLNGPGRYERTLQLLAAGIIKGDVLIDRVFPFEAIAKAFDALRSHGRRRPKVMVAITQDAPGRDG